ncbi:hypothetical protein PHYSODRAFT_403700, partial [Phytophthora sojae]
ASNYVCIGQMKKLSWMRPALTLGPGPASSTRNRSFVTRSEKVRVLNPISTLLCSMYFMRVYYSCKLHKRVNLIALDEQLIQHKITFCTKCVEGCFKWDTQKPVQSQAVGYEVY